MMSIVKWITSITFILAGFYYMAWAYKSSSFSVAAEPVMSEIYKTKALIFFPLSIVLIAIGIIFFICIGKK